MRAYIFCAGPAAMPEEVLKLAQEEFLDWGHTGSSIMEISHRSSDFIRIARSAEQSLRDLMKIPDNYKVLFMQGGATGQFSIIPMNLLRGKKKADYANTGIWSKKAIKEAKGYCEVNVAVDCNESDYTDIPDFSNLNRVLDGQTANLNFI